MAIRRRTVTGTVEKPHESWEGGTVTFRLRRTSFTADAVIPEGDVTALTDEDINTCEHSRESAEEFEVELTEAK